MKLQTLRLTLTASKPLILRCHMLFCSISVTWKDSDLLCEGVFSQNFREKHGDHFENLTTSSIVSSQLLHEFYVKMQSKFKQTSKKWGDSTRDHLLSATKQSFSWLCRVDKNALNPKFKLHLNGKISVRYYYTR